MPTSADATPIVIDHNVHYIDRVPVKFVIKPDPVENTDGRIKDIRIAVAADGRVVRAYTRFKKGTKEREWVHRWSYGHKNNKDAPQISIGKNSPGPSHSRMIQVCRLVAVAWVPNPSGFPEVRHNDGDRSNNKAGNLEWVTHKDNMRRMRIATGRISTIEGRKAQMSAYYHKNKKTIKKQRANWRKNNRDKVNGYQRARRARQQQESRV